MTPGDWQAVWFLVWRDQRDEIARLTAALAEATRVLRALHTCVKCGASLIPDNTPPHCLDCVVGDPDPDADAAFDWETLAADIAVVLAQEGPAEVPPKPEPPPLRDVRDGQAPVDATPTLPTGWTVITVGDTTTWTWLANPMGDVILRRSDYRVSVDVGWGHELPPVSDVIAILRLAQAEHERLTAEGGAQ